MSKKVLFLISLSVLFFWAIPLTNVSAQLFSYGPSMSIYNILPDVENLVALIFSAFAVICFVIAGILFLTAQGQAEKLTAARSAVIWGIVGVVVGLLAFSIIGIVSNFFT